MIPARTLATIAAEHAEYLALGETRRRPSRIAARAETRRAGDAMPADVAALEAELRRTGRLMTQFDALRVMGVKHDNADAVLVKATGWLRGLYEAEDGRLGLLGVTVEEPPHGAEALVEALRGGPMTRQHAGRLVGAYGFNVALALARVRVWYPAIREHADGTVTLEAGA